MGFKLFRSKKGKSSKDNPDIPSSSRMKKSSPDSEPKNTDIASSSGAKTSSPDTKITDIPSPFGVKKSNPPSDPKNTDTLVPSSSSVIKPSWAGGAKNSKFKKINAQKPHFAPKEQGKPNLGINSRIFTFTQMERATNNFNAANILHDGRSGKVYRGRLDFEQLDVAIKRLKDGTPGIRNFLNELETLSRADHPNIIKLIGHCSEGAERLMVYEYMAHGSLNTRLELRASQGLDWNRRVKIAAGVARALHYIRDKMKPPKIHRDIKSGIILLDDRFNPKLSGFGMALLRPSLGPVYPRVEDVFGTRGYMAPEYATKLTHKNDVYGFGVVLLEIFTGRKPINKDKKASHQEDTIEWAREVYNGRKGDSFLEDMADPKLRGRYPKRSLHQVLSIALKCLREIPEKRPSAAELVLAFDYIERQRYEPAPSQASQGHATSSLLFPDTSVRHPKGLKRAWTFPIRACEVPFKS